MKLNKIYQALYTDDLQVVQNCLETDPNVKEELQVRQLFLAIAWIGPSTMIVRYLYQQGMTAMYSPLHWRPCDPLKRTFFCAIEKRARFLLIQTQLAFATMSAPILQLKDFVTYLLDIIQ